MAKPESLPERLQYLQPFREFLAKLPKEEAPDADPTLLEELIHKQIKGKTTEEAKEKLNGDLEELEKYLSAPRRRNDRLHFVQGYLLIAVEDPQQLLKPPEKPKPIEERLLIDLPPKAKSKLDEHSLNVKWKRQSLWANKCRMDDDFQTKRILVAFAHPNASEYERLFFVENLPSQKWFLPLQGKFANNPSVLTWAK